MCSPPKSFVSISRFFELNNGIHFSLFGSPQEINLSQDENPQSTIVFFPVK